MTTPPVFVAAQLGAPGEQVRLAGAEGRHAAAALRLRPGEAFDLVDGQGARARCQVVAAQRDQLDGLVLSVRQEPAPQPRLVLVQALAKGDRGELAVELATELGVDAVVPWAAARCVVRWDGERGERSRQRWQATATAAAKQARRAWHPVVEPMLLTGQLAERPARLLVLDESATERLSGLSLPAAGEIAVLVGPEGGITAGELDQLRAAGAAVVGLGPTVLRSSTAGAAAISVLSAALGRW